MKKAFKKITVSVLTSALIATTMSSFNPVNAYADEADDGDDGKEKITLVSDKESKSEDYGDAPVAIYLETNPGKSSYDFYEYYGETNHEMAPPDDESTIEADKSLKVNIPEDVKVGFTQIEIGSGPELDLTFEGGIDINGNQEGYDYRDGLYFERYLSDGTGSDASIAVKGDISVSSKSYDSGPNIGVDNREDFDYSSQPKVLVTVDGNITSTAIGGSTSTALTGGLFNQAIAHGVEVEGNCLVTVKGNITTSATDQGGTQESIGIVASEGADVTVEKNLKSSDVGIKVNTEDVNPANTSLIIVKGDIMTAGPAVFTNIGKRFNENQLPTYVLGTLKDQNGNILAKPEDKLTVNSSDPELVNKVLSKIYYIADTSAVGYQVRIEGLKQIDGFEGRVAQAGDVLTMSVGSSSVLEGVEAGPYATVEQVNEYTYLITVNHGGGLKLRGIWTPAVTALGEDKESDDDDDHVSTKTDATTNAQTPAGSGITVNRSDEGGSRLVVDIGSTGKFDLSVSDLLTYVGTEGAKDIIIRTAAGSFTISIADLLALAGNNGLISFVLRNGCLEVYIGTQLVTTFAPVS